MLKTGWKVAFALFYTTVAYAGGECAQIYYCYHNCGDSGQPYPQIATCSLLSGNNYSILYNGGSPTKDCNSIGSGYPQCPGYKPEFFTDPSITKDPGTNKYSCKGFNTGSTNAVAQTIHNNCTQAFKSKKRP